MKWPIVMLLKYKNPVVFFFKNSIRGITLFPTLKNVKNMWIFICQKYGKLWSILITQFIKHIKYSSNSFKKLFCYRILQKCRILRKAFMLQWFWKWNGYAGDISINWKNLMEKNLYSKISWWCTFLELVWILNTEPNYSIIGQL